jgi:hypothetical protein
MHTYNRYFSIVLLISLVTIAFACVDKFDPGLKTNVRKLVVDGEITNKPGPYRVTLQQSSPFGTKEFSPPPFNVVVTISDDLGNSENLVDLTGGLFETVKTQGIVGRSYTLTIKIGDNRVYKSTPQLLKAPVKIDKIYSEYIPYKDGSSTYIGGDFQLFLDTVDPATKGDYYRWNYINYDPVEYCLARRFKNDAGSFAIGNPCCEPCWDIKPCLGCIYLGTDLYSNGKKLTKNYIAKFPYNSIKPVFLLVEQKSISKENYYFWKQVDSQINNSGGIFDTPPVTVAGNIYNVNDAKEQVLGFFSVAGVDVVPYRLIRSVPNISPIILKEVEFTLDPACVGCTESLFRTGKKPQGY